MDDLIGYSGQWYERYQHHGTPLGHWIFDMTEVQVKEPGTLTFKSFNNPVGEGYEAEGSFQGRRQIVGQWRETQKGAVAKGTFHLYIDPFGQKMYGICTGPSSQGQMIYSGWILARNKDGLDQAQRDLHSAMLVRGSAVVGNRNVFIVHGHDEAKKLELNNFLSKLDLQPIILHEQDDMGKTIIEKLEHYASQCTFAFVLMTPDDKLQIDDSTGAEWRARQNVILELGLFMGKLGRDRVVLLHKGKLEIPSDIHGLIYLKFNESILEVSEQIRRRLKGANLID